MSSSSSSTSSSHLLRMTLVVPFALLRGFDGGAGRGRRRGDEQKGNSLFLLLFLFLLFLSWRVAAAAAAAAAAADEEEEATAGLTGLRADFSNSTANGVRREGVDTALRKYAFMALSHARTGVVYNVSLPPFLAGISAQALRLRSGSARSRGLVFNQFAVPQGALVVSGGPFVVLVYRNIFNFTVYSLPDGFHFVSPVVGIVLYTSLNTSFDDHPLPEMNVASPVTPITARVPLSHSLGDHLPLCAFFDINGTVTFLNVSSAPNVCSSSSLMDVALVLPSSPVSSPAPPISPAPTPLTRLASKRSGENVWKIALLAGLGGVVALALSIAIALLGVRVSNKCKMASMEEPADNEETLQTSLIGHTRAPTALGVRTRPILETGSLRTRGTA